MLIKMSNREYGNLLTAKMLAICPQDLVASVQEKLLQRHSASALNAHMQKLGITDKFDFEMVPAAAKEDAISNNQSVLPKPGH